MSFLVKLLGAAAIVAVSFLGTLWVIDRFALFGPPCPSGETVNFTPPFPLHIKVGYLFNAPALTNMANGAGALTQSRYVLCENGMLLGPGNSELNEIGTKGQGRFNHWMSAFIFSASDNTNPNNNGRTYRAVRPR
jgi:hypothetical protein